MQTHEQQNFDVTFDAEDDYRGSQVSAAGASKPALHREGNPAVHMVINRHRLSLTVAVFFVRLPALPNNCGVVILESGQGRH